MSRSACDLIALWEGTFAPATVKLTSVDNLADHEHRFDGSVLGKEHRKLAFAEVLEPLVERATAELEKRTHRAAWSRLSSPAKASLQRSLLQIVSSISAQPLRARLDVFQAEREAASPPVGPRARRSGYDRFIHDVRGASAQKLFPDSAPLAATVGTVIANWIASTNELLLRLDEDAATLDAAFGAGTGTSRVVDIVTDLSDRHDGGRVVMALSFENGGRIVYKPRDVGMESAYNALLQWLNRHGLSPALRSLTVVERSPYGWVEAAMPHSCDRIEEVKEFYERAGMLLALLAFLDATDCHMSNLGACGAHPLLWDTETLLTRRVKHHDRAGQDAAPLAAFDDLSSNGLGILPYREYDHGYAYDLSALGGTAVQATPYRVPVWHHHGDDGPRVTYQPAMLMPQGNRVFLKDTLQHASQYSEQILAGFHNMYTFLSSQREHLLASDGLLRIARQPRRLVIRRTRDYFEVLTRFLWACYEPGSDGARRTRKHLRQLPVVSASDSHVTNVLQRELEAIVQLDIPRFMHRPSADDVRRTCVRLAARLEAMSESDLERELGQIRVALVTALFQD